MEMFVFMHFSRLKTATYMQHSCIYSNQYSNHNCIYHPINVINIQIRILAESLQMYSLTLILTTQDKVKH